LNSADDAEIVRKERRFLKSKARTLRGGAVE
jgi:hypothetical protein